MKKINTEKFVEFLKESIKKTYLDEGKANNKAHMTEEDYMNAMKQVTSRNTFAYILSCINSEIKDGNEAFMEEISEEAREKFQEFRDNEHLTDGEETKYECTIYYSGSDCTEDQMCCFCCGNQDHCTSRCTEYDVVEYACDCKYVKEVSE